MEDLTLKLIKVGRVANDGTGDDLRTASQTTNANLVAVKAALAVTRDQADLALATAQKATAAGGLRRIAAATIPPSTVVVGIGDLIVPANPRNLAHRGLVLGIVAVGVAAGEEALIQQFGALDGVSGTFRSGEALFIAENGSLTRTAPQIGWRQCVGYATSDATIVVGLGIAYAIREAPTFLPTSDLAAIAGILVATLTPDVLRPLIAAVARNCPLLPDEGPIPAEGGCFRRGSNEIYSLVFIEPQS